MDIRVTTSKGAVLLDVFVQPRAARNAIAGEYRGALKVKTTAPPVEGKANAAVEALIAEWLGLPKRAVTVVAGAGSRTKKVAIVGCSEADVEVALRLVLSSRPHEPG